MYIGAAGATGLIVEMFGEVYGYGELPPVIKLAAFIAFSAWAICNFIGPDNGTPPSNNRESKNLATEFLHD